MESFFLIKPGEILLKQDNQGEFIGRLVRQLKARLGDISCRLEESPGRFFLTVDSEHEKRARFVLEHCPGLNGYSKAIKCAKTVESVLSAAVSVAADAKASGLRRFKAETRRSDKSFPLGSYELSALCGEKILEMLPGLIVDVHKPEFVVNIEIRERAYVYGATEAGPRGLPSGSGGKGLLLLSGGIDSPVAGYMMARRGLALEAAYFHTYPYTSDEAKQKVIDLAHRIAAWSGGIKLWVLPFTEVQMKLKQDAQAEASTIMLRSAMMEAAHSLAQRIKAGSIITGESLGQVASQTAENMRITQAWTSLPVLRPLVGIDKEETVALARKIGTYETSILPYEDCCVLFSPRHPLLKPDFETQKTAYEKLGLSELIAQSLQSAERIQIKYSDVLAKLL
jgi:thiamine biosynthesis protein ThiI